MLKMFAGDMGTSIGCSMHGVDRRIAIVVARACRFMRARGLAWYFTVPPRVMLRYRWVPAQEVFREQASERRIQPTAGTRADLARRDGGVHGVRLRRGEHIEDRDACAGVEAGAVCAIRQQTSHARGVHRRSCRTHAIADAIAVTAPS